MAYIYEDVADALDTIHKRDGYLTPAMVIDEASDELSPLHAHFEWNDGKAADAHRLWQARMLIKSVKIERPNDGRSMPKYLSVKIGTNRQYEEATVVVSDIDKWTAVLADASNSLSELEKHIEDLIFVGGQVDGRKDTARRLKDSVVNLRERFDRVLEA